MSDDEYMSEESYEFEFEDDDVSDDNNSAKDQLNDEEQLQNDYYEAKAFKDEDPTKSITKFQLLLDSNNQKPDTIQWLYKSTKQIAKIYYSEHEYHQCLQTLKTLKPLIPQIEDHHYLEESMNKTFNNYSNNKDKNFMLELNDVVLDLLHVIKLNRANSNYNSSDRLWIKINLNRFSILLNRGLHKQCEEILKALQDKLSTVSDVTKNSYSLEIIASEIEFLTLTNIFDIPRLNSLYQKSLGIVSPVTHPRIMGIIKQCGGKLEFYDKNYHESKSKFYESFKNFDESGSIIEKKESFKYLILLSIITENEFNPFESQETQHYIEEEEFIPLISLLESFNDLNLIQFSTTCDKWHTDTFLQNQICMKSIDIIQELIIEKKLLNIFKSFTNVSFDFIQEDLKVSENELVNILMKLGIEGKLFNVKVDFVDKVIRTQEVPILKLPPNLSPKQIIHNLRSIISIDLLSLCNTKTEDVEFSGDICGETDLEHEMVIDRPPGSVGSNVGSFMGNNNQGIDNKVETFVTHQLYWVKVPTQPGLTTLIEEWYKLLESSFPDPHQQELSTKDQILSEQKLIKSVNENENNSAGTGTVSGASGGSTNLLNANLLALETEPEPEPLTSLSEKLRLLKLLSSELVNMLTES